VTKQKADQDDIRGVKSAEDMHDPTKVMDGLEEEKRILTSHYPQKKISHL
jgi:hypothetical protein